MSIPELRQSDSGVWYIHWTDGRRSKRVSTRQRDLASAKLFLGEWLLLEREKPKAGGATVAGKIVTVADLWQRYDIGHVQDDVASPTTSNDCWKNLKPHFGEMTLAEITQDAVDDYEKARRAGRIGRPSGASTVRKELVRLKACFAWNASPKRGNRRVLDATQIPAFTLSAARSALAAATSSS